MVNNTQKSQVIWFLKTIATVMVVYIHSANIFGYSGFPMPFYLSPLIIFANTGVPLFMIISGYLFFRKEVELKANFIKKIKRLAVPYLLWSGLWVIFVVVGHCLIPTRFEDILSRGINGIMLAWIGIPFIEGPVYGPLWYVRELFVISIFAPIFQKPIRRWSSLICVVAFVLWFTPINAMFRQTVVLFILGGTLSNKIGWIDKLKGIDRHYLVVLPLVCVLLSFKNGDFYHQLATLFVVIILVSESNYVLKNKFVQERIIDWSQYIFTIYALHGKFLSVLQILYTFFIRSCGLIIIGYIFMPVICIFLCLNIARFIKIQSPKLFKLLNEGA